MSDREAFEKFYREKVSPNATFIRNDKEQYLVELQDYAWFVWQAAQAQASKPIAAVHGWFHGECVIRALDPKTVLPAGIALYASPQPAVNQQLLEALRLAEKSMLDSGYNPQSVTIMTVKAAIAAAQGE